MQDALDFADRVRKKNPAASYTTAGHSLGAFLAMLVAAENGWSAVTYNGPDPWRSLSGEAKEWLRAEWAAGRSPFKNYVNMWDIVGNVGLDFCMSRVYVADMPGRGWENYHNIGDGQGFGFNADGSVKDAGVGGLPWEAVAGNAVVSFAKPIADAFTSILGTMNKRSLDVTTTGVGALLVTVNTVSAMGLAASIAGTAVLLEEIKRANARLIPRMEKGLLDAQNAASVLPYITVLDIENCVELNRLHVHQRIDEDAVAEVDRLVDAHISRVNDIAGGISKAVLRAQEQDTQWATAYAAHK